MERALLDQGVECETATTDDEGHRKRNNRPLGRALDEGGITRWYFPKQTEFYKVSVPLYRWLRRDCARFDAIHIHALFSYSSIVAARIADRAGIPYIIRPLGVLNRYGMTQRRAALKRISLRWLEGPLLRRAAAVHFTLPAEKQEAEELGVPFKSEVIPLAVPDPLAGYSANATPTRPYVLFLSRIDPKKNIESLIDAWQLLHARHSDWILRIAGSGEASYMQALRQHVAQAGLSECIEWPGYVAGEAKAHLLAGASIYVLPSHSENFGIAAAEAMLCGKACVFAPGVAVGTEAARRGAAMIADGNPEALASALNSLIESDARRRELGEKAAGYASSEFTAEVMGRRLRELYERIAT